jgi:hypothetical protein
LEARRNRLVGRHADVRQLELCRVRLRHEDVQRGLRRRPVLLVRRVLVLSFAR